MLPRIPRVCACLHWLAPLIFFVMCECQSRSLSAWSLRSIPTSPHTHHHQIPKPSIFLRHWHSESLGDHQLTENEWGQVLSKVTANCLKNLLLLLFLWWTSFLDYPESWSFIDASFSIESHIKAVCKSIKRQLLQDQSHPTHVMYRLYCNCLLVDQRQLEKLQGSRSKFCRIGKCIAKQR